MRGSVAVVENLASGTKLPNFETWLCHLHLCDLFPCVSNKNDDDDDDDDDDI